MTARTATGRPGHHWLAAALTALRLASGVIFVIFGLGKFVNHPSEASSFATYGLPHPGAFAYVIGVLELVGGALLLLGRLVLPMALLLAADMVGAIVVSGIGRGERVSLTLAPALLVVMLLLVWRELAESRSPRTDARGT